MSKSRVYKMAVTPGLDRHRLDRALVAFFGEEKPDIFSRSRLQSLIEKGHVSLSKKIIFDANHKVRAGEIYVIDIPPAEPATPKAQIIPLEIVYEDRDVLIINKPAGMVVHPAPGNRDQTLVNALLAHCGKSLSGIGGVARPGIVHRLDKDTSGLMVVAKNDLAHQALTKQFADRSLSRVYHALIWGVPAPRAGRIEGSIGRHPRDRKKMAVTAKGREALTYYKVIKSYEIVSLVECKLATGRTHQIRVHLAHKKYPVVGDPVYGKMRPGSSFLKGKGTPPAEQLRSFPRQALHAAELQFRHPRTDRLMRFQSELPEDMAALVRLLK